MKKLIYASAIVAAGLSSCAQNEIESVPALDQDNAVGFSTYSGNTKGKEMTYEMLQEKGFGLFGYYHKWREGNGYDIAGWENEDPSWKGADFMNNHKLAYDANAVGTIGHWIYSPIKYWPNNVRDRISFIGYAPYVDLSQIDPDQAEGIMSIDAATDCDAIYPTSKAPTIEYRMHKNPTDMIDLVGAVAFDQGKIEGGGLNGYENVVDLDFEHLMTKVRFYARLNGQILDDIKDGSKDTKVYVTALKLVGPENNTLLNKNGYREQSNALFTAGNFNYCGQAEFATTGMIGGWKDLSNEGIGEYYDLDQDGFLNFTKIKDTNYSKRGTEVVVNNYHGPIALVSDDEALYLLPPNNGEGLTEDQSVKVYVEYDVVTTDPKLPNGGRHVTTNRDIVDLNKTSLKMGVAYNVTIEIDVKSVNVDADVAEWEDEWFGVNTPNDSKDPK